MQRRSQSPFFHGARTLSTFAALAVVAGTLGACGWGTGSSYIAEPLTPATEPELPASRGGAPPGRKASVTLEAKEHVPDEVRGQNLGIFRNTYYDFPSETELKDERKVTVRGPACEAIADVPRAFYEALCVQGSGSLARGGTVSFAKRDCACAEVCPRTSQRICFESLDAKSYPWGRGAAGRPIAPLRSIAADTQFLPMGTAVYVPEIDGLPLIEGGGLHDGCLVVEDRGLKVRDAHIDIFTGRPRTTELVEDMLPSNQGVHVVVGTKRCARLGKTP